MKFLEDYQEHLNTVADGRGRLTLSAEWSQGRPGGDWCVQVFGLRDRGNVSHLSYVSSVRHMVLAIAVDLAVEEAKSRLPELWAKEPE